MKHLESTGMLILYVVFNSQSFDDSKMSILRMLHCFVLPKVFFQTTDVEKVELAKKEQIQNIQALNNKLESKCFVSEAQLHYAQLVPTQASAINSSSLDLFDAREQRDFLDKKLVLILTAREEIIDRKEDLPEMMEGQLNVILQDYMEKRYTLQSLKEERNKLTQQQYCALMVREMLDTILADLHNHGFSQADDADAKGVRPTD
ncbi:hypothetical protein QZH41_015321, partial [Actinostola sp. cb2023]